MEMQAVFNSFQFFLPRKKGFLERIETAIFAKNTQTWKKEQNQQAMAVSYIYELNLTLGYTESWGFFFLPDKRMIKITYIS